MNIGSPFLQSPFTDLTGCLVNAQSDLNSTCAKLEMRMNDCLEAYGMERGSVKCLDLMMDFKECQHNYKSRERIMRMRWERHLQYLRGERKDHYAESPRIDALF